MGIFTTSPRTVSVGNFNTATGNNTYERDFIDAFGAWTSYTPTWGSTGTAPAIGNGTLVGFYTQIQKTVFFRVGVTFGSTTTFGTGNYTLTLPVAPSSSSPYWSWVGYGLNGGTTYRLSLDVNGGSSSAVLNYQSATTGAMTRVGATAPTTWATSGNGFWFNGVFETA